MNRYIKLFISFLAITLITLVGTLIISYVDHSRIIKDEAVELIISYKGVEVPKPISRAVANYHFSQWFFTLRTIVTLLIPLIFYKFGFNINIKEKKNHILNILRFILIFLLFEFILTLPITYFSSYYRLKLVGLSNMTLILWFENIFKDFIINGLVLILVAPIIYYIFRKYNKWYIIVSLLYIPVSIFSVALYPVYIEPLYNNYSPLRTEIREPVKKLIDKANINKVDLYEVDKSKETSALNAYMTGIFNTKRIVIWDNTITQLKVDEVLSIVAHEIGHYKLNHIPKGIALSSVIVFFTLFVSDFCYKNVMRTKGKLKEYKDIKNLPILLFIIGILSFSMTPIENYFSRIMETEADKFAIELTEDNNTNAILEVRFMETNLSMDEVSAVFKWLVFTHPSTKERIEMSNSYKPWETGEWKYKKYMK